MDDVAATSIQDAAQVIKGTANVDVRDVNMPVFMGLKRLNETAPLFGGFTVPAFDQICRAQNTINAAGTDCNNILVEHHKGQSPIPFQPMVEVEVNNSPLLTVLQPEITGDQGIVLIDLAVALLPVVILAGGYAQPVNKVRHSDAGALGPAFDEVNHRITDIMGDPGRF